jgi:hypothetical protein
MPNTIGLQRSPLKRRKAKRGRVSASWGRNESFIRDSFVNKDITLPHNKGRKGGADFTGLEQLTQTSERGREKVHLQRGLEEWAELKKGALQSNPEIERLGNCIHHLKLAVSPQSTQALLEIAIMPHKSWITKSEACRALAERALTNKEALLTIRKILMTQGEKEGLNWMGQSDIYKMLLRAEKVPAVAKVLREFEKKPGVSWLVFDRR